MKKEQFEALQKGFERDIAQHQLRIIREDGVYRHIRCRRPDTWAYGFDLITWPGFLAYTGDMGEFLFARVEDMFNFFRTDGHGISYGYWAEKCKAGDRTGSQDNDGVYEFSEELFKEHVEEDYRSWLEDHPDAAESWNAKYENETLRERLEHDVLSCSNEGMIRAYDAATGFEVDGKQVFQDFWEHNCRDYTHRFLWCCHAIRWGIARYDALKAEQAVVAGEVAAKTAREEKEEQTTKRPQETRHKDGSVTIHHEGPAGDVICDHNGES